MAGVRDGKRTGKEKNKKEKLTIHSTVLIKFLL